MEASELELLSLFQEFGLKKYAMAIAEKLEMSGVEDFAFVEETHIDGVCKTLDLKPVPEGKLWKLYKSAHERLGRPKHHTVQESGWISVAFLKVPEKAWADNLSDRKRFFGDGGREFQLQSSASAWKQREQVAFIGPKSKTRRYAHRSSQSWSCPQQEPWRSAKQR